MQKSIRTIQAEPTLPKRLRVAAYARVSCDKDTMLHSLAEQVSKYSRMIQSNTAWEYAGVYADEGITGTKEDRPEFQRLLADCRDGKIDMIITKSISRFARNTVTLLKTVRELKLLGIDVFFEENKIHSLQAEGEVLLTILSSYAQAESFSASENTKWRIRKGFERGEVMNWRFMYGYNITKDSVEIDEAEAAIIREVFNRARDGESFRSICRDLNERGIRGLLGGKWSTAYLYQVLGNEKYAGNALLQKTFVNNHIDKKVVRNNGELPRIFVEGSHPPIVDQDTLMLYRLFWPGTKPSGPVRSLLNNASLPAASSALNVKKRIGMLHPTAAQAGTVRHTWQKARPNATAKRYRIPRFDALLPSFSACQSMIQLPSVKWWTAFTLTKGIDWSLLSRMEWFVKPHGRTAAVQKAGRRR